MFDLAWTHFLLVILIAVILLGPKELPMVLRFLGRMLAKIRHHTAEFRDYFETVANEAPPLKVVPYQHDKTAETPPKPESPFPPKSEH